MQEGKKNKLFADHVTQVCKAHDRLILSFLQQMHGIARPTTGRGIEGEHWAHCAQVRMMCTKGDVRSNRDMITERQSWDYRTMVESGW